MWSYVSAVCEELDWALFRKVRGRFFLMKRSFSALSAVSLFLFSSTICDTELNSLSLSTLLHGAERYLRDIWARVGNSTLLTPRYCSGLYSREVVVSPRYVSKWMAAPTGALLSDVDACSSAISSNTLFRLLLLALRSFLAGGSLDPPTCLPLLQTPSAALASPSPWPLAVRMSEKKRSLYLKQIK